MKLSQIREQLLKDFLTRPALIRPLRKIKALKNLPTRAQWQGFFRLLSRKEKILFSLFALLFLASLFYLGLSFYFQNTELVPKAGGSYKEGILGQPRLINPLYATSDAERDLVELLFEGLMKYSSKGEIVPSLAESYEIKEQGKVYEFSLRENLFWSDGEPLTSDDILFTIKILQDPSYRSPYLASWLDVGVEKRNEKTVAFHLKRPYLPFLELATFKIIPKHIWQEVPAANFSLAPYNLRPVVSGPYQIEEVEQDELGFITEVTLSKNPFFFDEEPFLTKIQLLFFEDEKKLLNEALAKKIEGLTLQPPVSRLTPPFKTYRVLLPRYFALFLNPEKAALLNDKRVRQALSFATDREEILKQALKGQGEVVSSPLLPGFYGFAPPSQTYEKDRLAAEELLIEAGFTRVNAEGVREKMAEREVVFQFKRNLGLNSKGEEVKELQGCLAQDMEVYPEGEITGFFGQLTKAAVIRFQEKYHEEILDPQGLTAGTGAVRGGTREKLNELCARINEEVLELTLELVTVDQEQLKKVAEILKEQWQEVGVALKIKTLTLAELEQNYLRPRNYEVLLFGQVLGAVPDLFPFWHSKQTSDPGLNLAHYESKEADRLMMAARQAQTWQELAQNYEALQNIILDDAPAIFLYSPSYLYFVNRGLKGIKLELITDPSKRFSNIEEWYIKTKRVWNR